MDARASAPIYRFEGFELDGQRRVLRSTGDGRILELTPRALDLLIYLVERAGQLVEKDTLLDAIWPNVIVEEGNLTQTVHLLRRALGEHPEDHRYVVTVPRRGYRFVAEVSCDPASAAPEEVAAARVESSGDMRAAMPVRALRWMPVVGLLCAIAIGGIVYFGIERDRDAPGASHQTRAYADMMRGQFFYHRQAAGDLRRAERYFRNAIEGDPGLAGAWTGLAAVIHAGIAAGSVSEVTGLPQLRNAAERALSLDAGDAEAYYRLAAYHERSGAPEEAERLYRRALELGPRHPLLLSVAAGKLADAGRLDEAIELQHHATALEPVSAVLHHRLGQMLYDAGRIDEAAAELRATLELNPALGADKLAVILVLQHRLDEAEALAERRLRGAHRDFVRALLAHARGQSAASDAALMSLTADVGETDPFRIAEAHAFRGEPDRAFDWLAMVPSLPRAGTSVSIGPRLVREMRGSPLLASLHADPRWKFWIEQMQAH